MLVGWFNVWTYTEHPTRRVTAMFQTFAVEVLKAFLARRGCCRGADDVNDTIYIIQGKVRERDSSLYYNTIPQHCIFISPPKPAHLGSSGDGVIVWGLEEACRASTGKVGS